MTIPLLHICRTYCLLPSLVMDILLPSIKVDFCNVVLVGLPQCNLDHFQIVINAAACLTVSARKFDHITLLLIDLHWLCVLEQISKVVYADTPLPLWLCSAPKYLADLIQPVAATEMRQRLRSASTTCMQLIVPSMWRSMIDDCSFAVAALRAWNKLRETLQRVLSPLHFKQLLKTYYF